MRKRIPRIKRCHEPGVHTEAGAPQKPARLDRGEPGECRHPPASARLSEKEGDDDDRDEDRRADATLPHGRGGRQRPNRRERRAYSASAASKAAGSKSGQ